MMLQRLLPLVVLVGTAGPMRAQAPEIRGYYLNVGSVSRENAASAGGVGDLQRIRVMASARSGVIAGDVAYEQSLTYRSAGGLGDRAEGIGGVPGGAEWLELQGTLAESAHVRWRHRVDRLFVTLAPIEAFEMTVGRQTISWATTLFLTPADPFVPFDPAEPFRDYRAGVDALRARAFLGNFTDIDVVVRPSDSPAGKTVTVLARGKTVWRGIEGALWAGSVHDQATVGLGTTATVAGAAVRGEGVLRRHRGRTVKRFAIGVDRSFPLAGRDLYVVAEYQHDDFGAGDAGALANVIASDAFVRRELQVLGQHVVALQASLQPHPLWSAAVLSMLNLTDESVLAVPSLSYSAGNELTLRSGVFVGFGPDLTPMGLPSSEFGLVPTTFYLALSAFF